MKTLFKTVSVTLAVSVTVLFFSCQRVKAAAGTLVASSVAVAIGAIVSFICASVADYVNSSLDKLSADVAAELKWDKMDKDRIAAEAEKKVNAYFNSAEYYQKIQNELYSHDSVEEYPISKFVEAQAYFNSVSSPNAADNLIYSSLNALEVSGQTITIDQLKNQTTLNQPLSSEIVLSAYNALLSSCGASAGAIAGVSSAISTVNGKPQKATTVTAEQTIEVFDYLDLNYKIVNNLNNIQFDRISSTSIFYYKPFIITSDNIIYSMDSRVDFGYSSGRYYLEIPNYYSSSIYKKSTFYQSFRFYVKNGILCFAFYSSYIDPYSNMFYRSQAIASTPKMESYPVLFSDKLSYSSIADTSFDNQEITFKFKNNLDGTLINANDVLSLDIASVGYFIGNPSDSILETAFKMLTGTENAVQGGTTTTYTDLSDIEKAIYALAKQQGISYDEMLKQCNIMINENGEMYLETLDGVTQSIDNLLSEFEKLLEQGSISNEQGAETVEQLTALLAYLKSLNIEGTTEYIAKIEATLDGLNKRDEDQSVLLVDVVGTLQDIKSYLESLGVNSAAEDIKAISKAISEAQAKEEAMENFQKKTEEEITAAIPFNNDFKLYNQCKYFIETVFNYDDIVHPPNFSFYWDSNGDGVKEIYNPLDFSILETKLTNQNMVDKSIFAVEIKVIDIIRYVIAICIYGLFVMRLIKRLPTFYGSGPWAQL